MKYQTLVKTPQVAFKILEEKVKLENIIFKVFIQLIIEYEFFLKIKNLF